LRAYLFPYLIDLLINCKYLVPFHVYSYTQISLQLLKLWWQ